MNVMEKKTRTENQMMRKGVKDYKGKVRGGINLACTVVEPSSQELV